MENCAKNTFYEVQLKKHSNPYFFQMQLQMFVCKVTFGEFFMCSPVEQNNYL